VATIRIPEHVWASVRRHLFSTKGEHFAFLQARWTSSLGEPIFIVHDVILVPDAHINMSREGWELSTEGLLTVINTAVRSNDALIEVHNHGGTQPRFSRTDREGLREFPAYVFSSLPERPYGATVWGDSTIYAEFFLPDGRSGPVDSITVAGDRFWQLVSRDDDMEPVALTFDRQLLWFTPQGQRALGRIRVGIVGNGGTGAPLVQNLVYLGVRNFVLIDDDAADDTSMNRLVTAAAADIGTPKPILGRRLIKSVAPEASVTVIAEKVESPAALDALKGVDVLFGCVDNDGARLILNEIALAYCIPYFDLAVGIEVENGVVKVAGGRVTAVLPGGPCLHCMKQIDAEEARFFLSDTAEQTRQIARGYVRGMDVKAPSVVSLNATIAAVATNEFAIYVSGLRPVNVHSDIDILGVGRPLKAQWMTPIRADIDPACVQCTLTGVGDGTCIERYSHPST